METIIVLLVCGTMAGLLMLINYTPSIPTLVAPWLLLAFCVIALCTETRTFYFNQEGFRIRYHILFITRKIKWNRVNSVEFVYMKGTCYYIISLDRCPSYKKTNMSITTYRFMHPVMAIIAQIPEKKREEYLGVFKQFCPETVCVDNLVN